ncbi:MAG: hypothetical protein QM346_10370 [Chloroflexota bacterium]|nr:hypothetical protein [Chloroflexota bacterium]
MEQPDFPYYNTVDQIYHAEWSTAKLARLELLRESIAALWPNGHPTRLIHVAGTGGKGSTCRFLEVGFGCAGKAGSFMSPHLFDYRERFSVGAEFVSRADVNELWSRRIQPFCVRRALRGAQYVHTFHEVSILLALALFERHEVEWAAMETGVGGRYDQTRALDVVATALTNVGGDHAHILGREQWQRALDKAGIARRDTPFFTSETDPDTLAIIEAVCGDAGAPLTVVGEADVRRLEGLLGGVDELPPDEDALLGAPYQKWNAALSMAVVQRFLPELEPGRLVRVLAHAKLPGRFWRVEEGVYADIAHNVEKMRALAGEVDARFGNRGKILILGISGKRAPAEVFRDLARVAKAIIVTGSSYKGQDPSAVRDELNALTGDTPVLVIYEARQALQVAKSMRSGDDVVLLTGSTYMIEQALNPDPYLRTLSATFGWRMQTDTEATGTVSLTLPKPPSPYR